jgi:hypothetical protein
VSIIVVHAKEAGQDFSFFFLHSPLAHVKFNSQPARYPVEEKAMATLVEYNGIQVIDTPGPTGDGGIAINDNFKKLSTHIPVPPEPMDPGEDDDESANFSRGSRWINPSTNTEFVCTDATTGSAVWLRLDRTLIADGPSDVPLIVQGAASQSANLTEWKTSDGTVTASVSSLGAFSGSINKLDCIDNTNYITFYQSGINSGIQAGLNNQGGFLTVGYYNNSSFLSISTSNGSPRCILNRTDAFGDCYIRFSIGGNYGTSFFLGNFSGDGAGINLYTSESYKLMNFSGSIVAVTGRIRNTVLTASVSVGGSVNTDWSAGIVQDITADGNFTINNPSSCVNGDRFQYRIYNDGMSAVSITLGSNFRFGTSIASINTIPAGKTTVIECQYNTLGGVTKVDVIDCSEGF